MLEDGSGALPLPTQLTPEMVGRIFGFTQPKELRELLQKCPRHYIRVTFLYLHHLLSRANILNSDETHRVCSHIPFLQIMF
jgi:hypothetical protein